MNIIDAVKPPHCPGPCSVNNLQVHHKQQIMVHTLPFNEHVAEYEAWFERYPFVFQSEVEAIRELLPEGDRLRGIEVGLGTGKFSEALGIREGVEPAPNMRALALKRGIEVMAGEAELLPYKDLSFDFVLMAFSICFFDDLSQAFREAKRVLKNGGSLIVGFLDRNSTIGKQYEDRKTKSLFYRNAHFFGVKRVLEEFNRLQFGDLRITQTLFRHLDEIREFEPAKPGYGEGSFVVIRGIK